jgi:hypothetical protein
MNSGKERRRSSRSSGRPWIVDAVKGEGRTGLVGLVADSYARMVANVSGTLCRAMAVERRIVGALPMRKLGVGVGVGVVRSGRVRCAPPESDVTACYRSRDELQRSSVRVGRGSGRACISYTELSDGSRRNREGVE